MGWNHQLVRFVYKFGLPPPPPRIPDTNKDLVEESSVVPIYKDWMGMIEDQGT